MIARNKTQRIMEGIVQVPALLPQKIESFFTKEQLSRAISQDIFSNQVTFCLFVQECKDLPLATRLLYIAITHDAIFNELFCYTAQIVDFLSFDFKNIPSEFMKKCRDQLANKILTIEKIEILFAHILKNLSGRESTINIATSDLAAKLKDKLITIFPDKIFLIIRLMQIRSIALEMRIQEYTGFDAYKKGLNFYTIGTADENHRNAVTCFNRATQANLREGFFMLGRCYQLGKGVEKNNALAAMHFYIALRENFISAEALLTQPSYDFDSDLINEIGDIYFKNNLLPQAKYWFKAAIEKGSFKAIDNLCDCYNAPSNDADTIFTVLEYYKTAALKKNATAKLALKKLINHVDQLTYLTKQQKKICLRECFLFVKEHFGDKQNFWLEFAIKGARLKDCARLLLMGAPNNMQTNPFSSLSPKEKHTISALQSQLAVLLNNLSLPASKVLARKVTVDHATVEYTSIERMFEKLYQIPDIAPLLDLAKLAALGLHNLGGPQKPIIGYDSDDDANPDKNPSLNNATFSMRFDATSKTIEHLYHSKSNNLEYATILGIYSHRNTIFMGAKKNPSENTLVESVLIHEITHFLANEIFNNQCNPYDVHDNFSSTELEMISARLEMKKDNLDDILNNAYLSTYKKDQYGSELIARVPQMIVYYYLYSNENGGNGITRLEKQAASLLKFYRNTFLPAVKKHTEFLKKRALSDWPEETFKPTTTYQF